MFQSKIRGFRQTQVFMGACVQSCVSEPASSVTLDSLVSSGNHKQPDPNPAPVFRWSDTGALRWWVLQQLSEPVRAHSLGRRFGQSPDVGLLGGQTSEPVWIAPSRAAVLDALLQHVLGSANPSSVTLQGSSGAGKTFVLSRLWHHPSVLAHFHAVVYVDVPTVTSELEFWGQLMAALRVAVPTEPGAASATEDLCCDDDEHWLLRPRKLSEVKQYMRSLHVTLGRVLLLVDGVTHAGQVCPCPQVSRVC
jgi:hypothetical protein